MPSLIGFGLDRPPDRDLDRPPDRDDDKNHPPKGMVRNIHLEAAREAVNGVSRSLSLLGGSPQWHNAVEEAIRLVLLDDQVAAVNALGEAGFSANRAQEIVSILADEIEGILAE